MTTLPPHIMPATLESPISREQTEVTIQVDGQAIVLQAPSILIERLSQKELKTVITKTRNIVELGLRGGANVDTTRIFRQQIDVYLNQKEFEIRYKLYRSVVEKFKIEGPHSEEDLRSKSRSNPRHNRIQLPVLAKVSEYILEQGWEIGTVVERIAAPHDRYAIIGMKRSLSLKLDGTTKTPMPLEFRTAKTSK
ncbi:MAG: hypothetical protein OEY44_03885 [Candidatus Peregrinibacteria bacterium]|nr:hypothetical protein [Candidatus Peregrinibacteria bacterium]